MMSGLVPTTTMCWLFSWDMGSFGVERAGSRRGAGGPRSEEVLAAARREEGAEPLEDAGVERLLPVEHVHGVLVGDHDQAARAERDDRPAVHAGDERVLGVELERRADRGDPLVVEHALEAG